MHKDFSDDAWADYTYSIMQDKKALKKINQLLADIERNGNAGIGHLVFIPHPAVVHHGQAICIL